MSDCIPYGGQRICFFEVIGLRCLFIAGCQLAGIPSYYGRPSLARGSLPPSSKLAMASQIFLTLHLLTYFLPFSSTFFFNIYLFIFGRVGSSLLRTGFLQLRRAGGYSSFRCTGFSLQWLLLLRSMGSRCMGFTSCGKRDQQLWHRGLVAPRHVGSSWTRDRTRVPCTGRWILNHCTTREAPVFHF